MGTSDDDHMERLRASDAPMASLADLQAFLRTTQDSPMIPHDHPPGTPPFKVTTDGKPADGITQGAPKPIDPETGQHKAYYILSDVERAKGFVRPVRLTYVHTGERPKHPVRDLTPEEQERHREAGYVKFEKYPDGEGMVGRFWTAKQLQSGCDGSTNMSRPIAETYARDPGFYGSTFCYRCGTHLPVREFTWAGTNETVGS